MNGTFRIALILFTLTFLSQRSLHSQISGTFNIPTNYPNIGAAINDLNAQGVNGPVVITVNAGHTETASAGGYTLSVTGTSLNTIVFQKSGLGANPVIFSYAGGTLTPGTASQDGIWHFVGCDFITVDGIDLMDLNVSNPATMEYGFGFFKGSSSDGCQNNILRNCTITLNRINNAIGAGPAVDGSRGINLVNSLISSQTTVLSVTSGSGTHSNNKFYSNTIQNCNIGIALIGFAAPSPFVLADTNNDVGGNSLMTGNTIVDFGGGGVVSPAAAVRTLAQYNLNVSYNTINNNTGSGVNHAAVLRGIYLNTAQSANVSVLHNTLTLQGGGMASQISGIENLSGAIAATNSVVIENNHLLNCSNASNTSGIFYGIFNNGASCDYLSLSSNVLSNNNLLSSSGSIFLLYNNASIGNQILFKNNQVSGNTFSSSTSGIHSLLYNNANSPAQLEISGNAFINNVRVASTGMGYCMYNAQPSTGSITFSNNLITGNTFSAAGGAFYGLFNGGSSSGTIDLSNNTYSNNIIHNSSGSIYNLYNTGATTGRTQINNNLIAAENTSISAAGTYYGIYNNSASASTISINNNQFQSSQFTAGTGSVHLIYNRGAVSTTFAVNQMNYNSILSCTFHSSSTSPFLGIYNSVLSSDLMSISHNTLMNLIWNSSNANKYLIQNNGLIGTSLEIAHNQISNCTNTLNATGAFYAVYNSGLNNGDFFIHNNQVTSLFSNASSGASALIFNSSAGSGVKSFTSNLIANCQFSASGTGDFNGIYNTGNNGTHIDLSANTFSNLSVQRFTGAAYLIQNTGPISTNIGTVSILNNQVIAYTGNSTGNAAFFGFYNNGVSAQHLNISNNNLLNSANTSSNGATHLIYNRGALTNTFSSIRFSNNSVNSYSFHSSGNGSFFGIYNNGVSVTDVSVNSNTLNGIVITSSVSPRYILFNSGVSSGSVQIQSNICSGLTSTANTNAVFFYINNSASSVLGTDLRNNVLMNSNLHASTGDIYGVNNSGTTTASVWMEYNVISSLNTLQSGSGVLYGICNNAASCSTLSISDNTITNGTRSSFNGATYWIYARGIATTVLNRSQIQHNLLTALSHTSSGNGPFYLINSGGGVADEVSVLGNTLSTIQWSTQNANRFLIAHTSSVNVSTNIRLNVLSEISSTLNANANFYGIYNSVPNSPAALEISENRLQDLNLANTNGAVQLIFSSGSQSGGVTLEQNSISDYTVNTSGNGDVMGIYNTSSSASVVSIRENTLSNANTSYSAGTVYDVYNTGVSSSSIEIQQNQINTISTTAFGGGARYIIYNNAASSPVLSINSNTLAAIQHTAGNGAVHFLTNRGTLSTTFNAVFISNNYIHTCAIHANTLTGNQNYVLFNEGPASHSLSIHSNTVSNFNWQTTASTRRLIYNTGTCSLGISIQNNVLQNHSNAINTSGHIYAIHDNSNNSSQARIESNFIHQINSSSTTGRLYLIYNSGNISQSVSISSNSLTNNGNLSGSNTSFYGIYNLANTSNSHSISANVIQSNTASTSNGDMRLIYNSGSATNTANQINIHSNFISGNTFSASLNGSFFGIHNQGIFSNTLSVFSNTISNHQSSLITGDRYLIYNTGNASSLIRIQQNAIAGITYTDNTSGEFYGIFNAASCNGSLEVISNSIQNLSLSSSTGTHFVVYNSGSIGVSRAINTNLISNVSFSSSASGIFYGIYNRSTSSQYLSISSNSLINPSILSYSAPIFLLYNTGVSTETVNSIVINSNEVNGGLQKIDAISPFYGIFNHMVSSNQLSLNNNRFLTHTLSVQQGDRFLVYNTSPSSSTLSISNNQFIGNLYEDTLGTAFYGLRNTAAFTGQLFMNNNTFATNTLSTKTSSLYLLSNSPPSSPGTNGVQLNANTFTANTFGISQNKPLYLVCQDGSTVSDLSINSNTLASNQWVIPSGNVYLLSNLSGITNSVGINGNRIVNNIHSTSATGDFYGIHNSATSSQFISLNSNTLSSNQSNQISGSTHLIFNGGIANAGIQINNNVLSHIFSNPVQAYTGIFNGINAVQSGSTASVDIHSNVFSSITFSTITGLGPLYFIKNSSDPSQLSIQNNAFANLQLRNSGGHYFIHNTGNVQAQLSVHSNSLSNYIRSQAGSGDIYFYFSDATAVPANCIQNFSANVISSLSSSIAGAGSFYGIFSADGGIGTFPRKQIHHNTILGINYSGNGDFIGYYGNYLGDAGLAQSSSLHNNTLSAVSALGNIFGMYHGANTSPNQSVLMHSNEIGNLTSQGISSSVYAAGLGFTSKEIRVYKNKMYSIQANGVSGRAYGIFVSNANNTEISNNRVGEISAPNSSLPNPVNGIYISGGSTVNLSYNTVVLSATSSVLNFNSNVLWASTQPQLSLRNNILLNLSSSAGNGIHAAYRRSSSSIVNHAISSDRNVLYAGVGGTTHPIYYDGVNPVTAIYSFQNLFSPRESNSQKEQTTFLSTTGSSNLFLMVDPAFPSFTESGAQNVTGITEDFDSQIRQGNPGYAGTGTAPDIGSDEYNQALPPCSSVNSGSISPASTTLCAGQNITLNSAGFTYSSAGGIQFQWQSSNSAGGPFTAVSGGSASNKTEYTSGALSSGTLYFVLSGTCTNNSQVSVSNAATVVVLPSPSVSISASSSTLCSGNPWQLNLSTDIGTQFAWKGPSNFTSAVQNPTIANVLTTSGGNYSVQVSAANGCTNGASYSLQVFPSVPQFTYSPLNPAICSGDSVLLSASIPVTSPTLVFSPQASQNPANGYPAPYSLYYGGQKMQFLIQSNELSSAGFVAGSPITSLEFPVVSLGSAWGNNVFYCQDFQVSMGHTSLNSITSFQSGMQVVLPAYNFSPVPGFNLHAFAVPFIWDGQSNVVVETLFSNVIFGTAATSVIQYNSPTGYQSTVVYRADNQSQANIAAATASNINVSNARPDFRLSGVPVGNYTWTPSLGLASTNAYSTQASPQSTQVYTTVLSNGICSESNTVSIQVAFQPTLALVSSATLVCVNNIATLSVSGANNYLWSTGSTNSLITVSPVGNSTYVVTGYNTPCPSASAAIQLSVAPALLVSAVSASPILCAGESTTLFAIGATSYTWSNGANSYSILVAPMVNTTYTVFGSNGPGCSAQQVLTVISNSLPIVQVSPSSATLCAGEMLELIAAGALTYTWLPENLSSSSLLIIPQSSTHYTLVGQGQNQCKSTVIVPVEVNPCIHIQEENRVIKNARVFPNPSSGLFLLEVEEEGTKIIRVFSTTGDLIYEGESSLRQIYLDLTTNSKGFYLLRVQIGTEEKNFKILIQ